MNKWVTVLAVTLPSPEVIEHARRVKGIPPTWGCVPCAAGCGEIVFYPPDAPMQAEKRGTKFAVVCSLTCAMQLA